MNYQTENGVLTIYLEGHIDSANAAGIETEINEILAQQNPTGLILDAEDLSYISSVGLRIILRLKKAYHDLSLINVASEVYEVFEMTGFTEMMDIRKGYRRLSIEGCEQIGQGSNGVVYRLDPDTIIKVYRNPDSLPDIHRERELARKAFVMGIPTAIPYDVVKVGNSYGSVFELLSAKSFSKIVKADPSRLDEMVDEFVKLLKQIHTTEVKPGEMPHMKDVALRWAKDLQGVLTAAESEKLLALIEAVPERDTMLHGDYHFNNVMVQNGEVLLIDMDTLCVGHPVFEFASIFLANKGFGELDHSVTEHFLGIPYETTLKVWRKTLEKYFGTTDDDAISEYENKAMVIGYTRLLRRTIRRDAENTAQIDHCKRRLSELLAQVDSLAF
ncbi:MAG: anti-sigma factor antagonist [Clostridia bacterium]|nr:anti-sigma factor antagonist [Clostridia bacterium]